MDDIRESPSLEILKKLIDLGADAAYSDPYIDHIPSTRKYNLELQSVPINAQNVQSADLILLATDHDEFDYHLIEKEAKLIVDYLTLTKRIAMVKSWVEAIADDTGRVHGKVNPCGAVTGRMTHSKPNCAQVPAT